jgi:hypothetical protein
MTLFKNAASKKELNEIIQKFLEPNLGLTGDQQTVLLNLVKKTDLTQEQTAEYAIIIKTLYELEMEAKTCRDRSDEFKKANPSLALFNTLPNALNDEVNRITFGWFDGERLNKQDKTLTDVKVMLDCIKATNNLLAKPSTATIQASMNKLQKVEDHLLHNVSTFSYALNLTKALGMLVIGAFCKKFDKLKNVGENLIISASKIYTKIEAVNKNSLPEEARNLVTITEKESNWGALSKDLKLALPKKGSKEAVKLDAAVAPYAINPSHNFLQPVSKR